MIAWITGWKPLVAEHDGLEHLLLGQLLGLRLHHHHGVVRCRRRRGRASLSAISSIIGLSTNSPSMKPTRAAPIGPRNGTPDSVSAAEAATMPTMSGSFSMSWREHGDDDLRLVLEAFDEQRPDRPVDEARGQRLLLGGTAFALEEAAGDLAGGVGLLLVVHGQREEVDAGLGGLRGDDGGEHAGLAVLGVDGGVGLARDAPGLERQLAAAPVNFHAMDVEHVRSFVSVSLRLS